MPKTANSSSQRAGSGRQPSSALGGRRRNGDQRADDAGTKPADEQERAFGHDDGEQRAAVSRTAPSSASSRRRLEHVAQQQDCRQPDRAEQQAETAECLEGREIGVLDPVELGQAFGGRRRIGAKVAQLIFDRCLDVRDARRGAATIMNW